MVGIGRVAFLLSKSCTSSGNEKFVGSFDNNDAQIWEMGGAILTRD